MRILFDQGTPVPLRHSLAAHSVVTAFEMGWSNLENGELLATAEAQFDVLVTTDQNLRYQQNLQGRRLAILVLPTTNWPEIRNHAGDVVAAINSLQDGEYRELRWG
jgi:predicted nuclease of predicted toxin-antitoxin system